MIAEDINVLGDFLACRDIEPLNSDTLQVSEVDEVRWFDLGEVWKEIQTDRSRICVPTGGLNVLREYLKTERVK